jgi:hypothetical protein
MSPRRGTRGQQSKEAGVALRVSRLPAFHFWGGSRRVAWRLTAWGPPPLHTSDACDGGVVLAPSGCSSALPCRNQRQPWRSAPPTLTPGILEQVVVRGEPISQSMFNLMGSSYSSTHSRGPPRHLLNLRPAMNPFHPLGGVSSLFCVQPCKCFQDPLHMFQGDHMSVKLMKTPLSRALSREECVLPSSFMRSSKTSVVTGAHASADASAERPSRQLRLRVVV